jgi:hypothetical protein
MKIRDLRKKYPQDVALINRLSEGDPSGTNKKTLIKEG